MNQITPFSQIQDFLTKSFYVPEMTIVPRLSFKKLGLSQTEFWEVVAEVENQNNISIEDRFLDNVKTIGDLVSLVQKTMNNG